MIIKTEKFKKMAKIILASMERGDRYSESIYLDFSKKTAYFTNSKYKGRFKYTNIDDDSTLDNVYFDTTMFLAICEAYDEITINDDYEIIVGDEKFKIASFVDVFDYPIFYETSTFAHVTPELKEAILEAADFSGKDSKFEGILIAGNSIVSTDRVKIYEAKLDNMNNPSIKLPLYLKTILNNGIAAKIRIYCFEGKILLWALDEHDSKVFEIEGSEMIELNVPNLQDPSFIEKYNHSTFFVFKRSDMIGVMKFLSPFVKNVINERIYISVDSEAKLSIEVKEDVKAKRIIDLIACSPELVGEGVWVRRSDFEKALSVLKGDIMLKLDNSKPAFDLSGEADKHVCIVRMVG